MSTKFMPFPIKSKNSYVRLNWRRPAAVILFSDQGEKAFVITIAA